MAIKISLGRLSLASPLETVVAAATDVGIRLLPLTVEHAAEVVQLPRMHGDPFDRMLAAQARVEGLAILGRDAALDGYGVRRIW